MGSAVNNQNHPAPQIGDRIGMNFWHGSINHPKYGKADNLGGVIPLLLPQGGYTPPAIASDPPRLQGLIRKLISEYGDLWEDDLEEKIAAKIKEYLFIGAYTNPQDDAETPGMQAIIANLIVIFAMDDIMDMMNDLAGEGFTYSNVNKLSEFYMGIYNGVYKTVAEIPNPFPIMQSTVAYFWKCNRQLEAAIPEFQLKNQYMREEWEICIAGFVLLMERDPPGEGFSEQSLKIFGAHNSGMVLLLEAVSIMRGVVISAQMRRDFIVRNIIEQMASVSTLMNAVFGFVRDVNLDQVEDSSILRRVVHHGVSLEQGFGEALEQLKDEINDIRVGARKLRARYPEDTHLHEWLRLVENIVDGQVYCYAQTTRYGNLDMRVVKTN